ncbi:unnamed protein product, partial [Effrenium voratum]
EALLQFECLAAQRSAELAEAQLREECAQLRAEISAGQGSELAARVELSEAQHETHRLRRRLEAMAMAKRTLKRRVQALCQCDSPRAKDVEQEHQRCRQLCEEAAVAININSELEAQRAELQSASVEGELSLENRELREKTAALEEKLEFALGQSASFQRRIAELESDLAE